MPNIKKKKIPPSMPTTHLKALPRRLRTRAPTHAPIILAPGTKPLLRTELQFAVQLRTGFLAMDEVAEAAADAALAAVEAAAGLAEVCHGREFAVDGPRGVPARVQRVAGGLRGVFVFEACVDVAD